jgi:uncharacterized protein
MVRRLVEHFDPLQIVLFGEHARYEADADTDVSLLMVLPEVGHKRDTIVQALTVLADMPVPKEVYVASPEEVAESANIPGSVVSEALPEGKVLWQR